MNAKEALLNAAQLLAHSGNLNAARSWIPYCCEVVSSGQMVLLNRDYAPLGVTRTSQFQWFKYDEYPEMMLPGDASFNFFDDGTAPWDCARNRKRLLTLINSMLKELA